MYGQIKRMFLVNIINESYNYGSTIIDIDIQRWVQTINKYFFSNLCVLLIFLKYIFLKCNLYIFSNFTLICLLYPSWRSLLEMTCHI